MDWRAEIDNIMNHRRDEGERLDTFIELMNTRQDMPPEEWQATFNQIFTYLGETMPLMEAFVVAFKMGQVWEANKDKLEAS